MKTRFAVAIVLFVSLVVVASTNIAEAQWPALSSGYAVTTNWHGENVPIGALVTAWAGTTDSEVEKVEFRWLDPDGNPVWKEDMVDVYGPYTTPDVPPDVPQEIIDWANDNPGVTIWYANYARTPDILGDWGVQAHFYDLIDPSKNLRGKNSDIIAIRATSFFEIPQVPFGTIAILLSMFGALGVYIKKKQSSSRNAPKAR